MLPLALAMPVALSTGAVYAAGDASECIKTGNASNSTITQGINSGVNAATTGDCTQASDVEEPSFSDLAAKVVNILSLIVGVVAVIMIIFGGFKYITSGGESGNVSGAKNTLIYAIVGLVIVALAQFVVHFVLNNVSDTAAVVLFFR